jgi:hypothetical protein
VNVQPYVSAILFHGLSSLLVALCLRLLRAESLIHALKVGQASIHNVYLLELQDVVGKEGAVDRGIELELGLARTVPTELPDLVGSDGRDGTPEP